MATTAPAPPAPLPIAPGVASGTAGYPQWGAGNPSGSWQVVEARNAAQKTQYTTQGYLTWFSSDSAAKNFVSSQTSALNGNVPGLTGLSAIGDFFTRLGQANTWIRVGEVVLGLILIAAGVAKITHAVPIATKIAGAIA